MTKALLYPRTGFIHISSPLAYKSKLKEFGNLGSNPTGKVVLLIADNLHISCRVPSKATKASLNDASAGKVTNLLQDTSQFHVNVLASFAMIVERVEYCLVRHARGRTCRILCHDLGTACRS